ncbi:MAG: DUF547 domain-containing protein [Myxococcota bacterium]
MPAKRGDRTASSRTARARSIRHRGRTGRSLLHFFFAAIAVALPSATRPEPASALDLDRYARLLARTTRTTDRLAGTEVDYAALVESPELDALVRQLEASRPSGLDRTGRIAFWIDAYNLLTLDLVRKHWPIDGIKDIGSFFFPVWKRDLVTIEGRSLSLDAIEHGILRPLGEPRIHAALVCASKSCPALRRAPYRPESLDEALDDAMRRFLADPRKGLAIDRAAGVIRVSKIFDWFEADFAAAGGVRAMLARHAPAREAEWLRGPGREATIRFFDYDWSLNGLE